MKLNNFIFENAPVSSAEALMTLSKIFPTINIKMNKYRQLEVGESRKQDAWPLLSVFFNMSKREITKEVTSHINTHNNYQWLLDWERILSSMVEQRMHSIVPKIPAGWRLDHYVFKFFDDPMEPRFYMAFAKDVDNRIHPTGKSWYHITLLSNKEAIEKNGLIPNSHSRHLLFGTFRDKIFLLSQHAMMSKKLDDIKVLAKELQSEIQNISGARFIPPAKYTQVAIFKVSVPISVHVYTDKKTEELGGAYIKYPIPPENLELVYTGDIDNITID